jgi:hypothetical protein
MENKVIIVEIPSETENRPQEYSVKSICCSCGGICMILFLIYYGYAILKIKNII